MIKYSTVLYWIPSEYVENHKQHVPKENYNAANVRHTDKMGRTKIPSSVTLLIIFSPLVVSFRPSYVTCVGCETFLQCFLTCPVADYPGVKRQQSQECYFLNYCSSYFSGLESMCPSSSGAGNSWKITINDMLVI